MTRFASAGLGIAVLVLALTALFTRHHVTPTHPTTVSMPAPSSAREPAALPDEAPPDDISDDLDAMIDLHGNGVSPAVATYSLDALGGLYEVHSPQTELPRLGSPKT